MHKTQWLTHIIRKPGLRRALATAKVVGCTYVNKKVIYFLFTKKMYKQDLLFVQRVAMSPGGSFMRKMLSILLIAVILVWPGSVSAAGFKVDVSIARQDDGTTYGEFWYNDQVIWRLAFSTDGAKPVSTGNAVVTTTVTPDIVNGLFVLKVR